MSTRGRYGLRAMLELALNYGKDPVLLREIAQRQEISAKYLEHIMARLNAAGLVRSIRGAHGGYALTRSPSAIRLSELVQVLEGSVAPLDCVDMPGTCPRSSRCVARDVWTNVKMAVLGVLESTTLQELVDGQRAKLG